MSEPEEDYAWRLVKRKGSDTASLELSSHYSEFEGPALTLLIHKIGEGLIKAGTMMLQSRVDDDDDDEDWD